ncbi:cue domain-containing protein [Stemphylium lycopersici]|uniref:Cue domain-containing protein n=1 Tax=Stemphylium lycopersici TaxID=183478 RepID=A0A364NAF7_STELY|nr:cue domain-containing protein [Stemphylium lycopersici]RAR14256.1 cue domain-containing protein [Stemphylium lycopersici]
MSLPHFAPFPDAKVRKSILPDEWHLYLDSWTSLAELYLRLGDQQFDSAVEEKDTLTPFLTSFFHELAHDDTLATKVASLRKKGFFLLHRLLSREDIPPSLLNWSALSDIGHVYPKSEQFRTLLQGLWKRKGAAIEKSLQTAKTSLIRNLESKRPGEAESTLNRIAPLLRASTDTSIFMLTGSDFLDALSAAYPQVTLPMQKKLVTVAYLGLTATLEGPKPNYSLLSDHLYSLKSSEEQEQKKEPGKKTLVADLVTNTPFLEKVRDKTTAPEATRVRNTAASLSAFRQPGVARPKKLIRRKVEKGKANADQDSYGHGAFTGEVHIHRMSIITQIQDLFPDLGAGFIVKCLDEYNDDIEQVTAHLLEDSLPPHLIEADRSETLPTPSAMSQPLPPPRSSQHIPERRNVFDNDDFDNLAVDTSRLHIGRRGQDQNADKILSDRSKAPAKSAIMAALAAFDSDDDERDDTYDAEDVGASVDTAAPGPGEDADLGDKNEEALYRAYTMTPELFGRESETRRGKARTALKSETGMTDEAIEGWAIMMGRNPRQLRRLEAKFSNFQGQQPELQSTAWRESPAGSGDEASGDASGGRGGRGGGGRGRGRGRGRGGPGGGRGGASVAGPSDDKGTQVSRQRKEANKGSSANHNRKAQRGKKMARAGFPAS